LIQFTLATSESEVKT